MCEGISYITARLSISVSMLFDGIVPLVCCYIDQSHSTQFEGLASLSCMTCNWTNGSSKLLNSFCALRTVVEVGDNVQRLKVGDRVTLEPGVPCWANPASR